MPVSKHYWKGHHILLCSRGKEVGERAASKQLSAQFPHRVSIIQLDVIRKPSIEAEGDAVHAITPKLPVLLKYAGFLEGPDILKTNYHAVIDITNVFLPLLFADADDCKAIVSNPRVIAMSSSRGTRLASLPTNDSAALLDNDLSIDDLTAKINELAKSTNADTYAFFKVDQRRQPSPNHQHFRIMLIIPIVAFSGNTFPILHETLSGGIPLLHES